MPTASENGEKIVAKEIYFQVVVGPGFPSGQKICIPVSGSDRLGSGFFHGRTSKATTSAMQDALLYVNFEWRSTAGPGDAANRGRRAGQHVPRDDRLHNTCVPLAH